MRYGRLAGGCSLLLAFQFALGCDDSGDRLKDTGDAGKSSTSGGSSSTAGTGGSSSGGSAGTDAGGEAGEAGNDTGGSAGTAGAGGSAGMGGGGNGGTGGTPMCTTDANCADTNPCTDDTCTDGVCKHTNNTVTCDDGNLCTSDDKCTDGACKGTNNTVACDDLSSCTTTDHCQDGACTGTKDTNLCPVCVSADNIIQNCDFTDGMNHWLEGFFEGGGGTVAITNERMVVDITSGGQAIYSVQPRQEPLTIVQGRKYTLRMVAGASVNRDIVFALTQAYAPDYQVYSLGDNPGGGFTMHLEQQMKPFSFDFVMTEPTDTNVKLELKLGGATGNPSVVYMDDIAVIERDCTGPADCDDGNECTDNACDTTTGLCSWTNNTATCASDDNACTSDVCAAGECTHAALADGAACTDDTDNCTSDVCEASACTHYFDNNACQCTTQANCDDRKVCTDDTCGGGGLCAHTNNTAACDDGDPCTIADVCATGACTPGTSVCFDCTTGGNLLTNCNLATDMTGWLPGFFGGGQGTQAVENGLLAVKITNGGTDAYMVQPRQEGIELVQGTTYVVRFNAMASVARSMIVSMTQNGGAFQSYSGDQTFNLTTQMQKLEFEFTMDAAPPAEKVKFEIRLGGTANNATVPNTVYLDNLFIGPKP